jgi:hypothetical protein
MDTLLFSWLIYLGLRGARISERNHADFPADKKTGHETSTLRSKVASLVFAENANLRTSRRQQKKKQNLKWFLSFFRFNKIEHWS